MRFTIGALIGIVLGALIAVGTVGGFFAGVFLGMKGTETTTTTKETPAA